MHCKKGVTCVYNGHVFYTVVITLQSNLPFSQFNSMCNEFHVKCLVTAVILLLFTPSFIIFSPDRYSTRLN